ncbi:MAG TPA: tripartite tricarboxylate transporter substrate binding protein [Candidatus Limnocylindria bacterium]|nr:tripartite tricarboxylate transporter substrate binding protein [Candidatus Limnocylindria bacterium]
MKRTLAILATFAILAVSCGGGGTGAAPTATTAVTSAPTAAATPAWKPTRPIELVVQAAAGGGSDIFARKIADILTKEKLVDQPINVVNKPGGSGAVAYNYVLQKKGDPHVLATVTLSYLATPLQEKPGFTFKDFSNLATLAVDDFIAVVKAESSYQSLTDLINAAKAKPKEIKVGGTQVGSSDSIIPALIEQATGAQFNYVTFRSGAEVNTAILGNTVEWQAANPGEAKALIDGKKLRAVAAFAPQPLKGYESVKTAKDQGVNVIWEQFRGIIAPGGIGEAEKAFWQKTLTDMTKSAEWAKYMEDNTLRALVKTGGDAEKYVDETNTTLRTVLTKLGLIK